MIRRYGIFLAAALFASTSVASAVERVEIVVDASATMWKNPGGGQPLFVAVREALLDYAAESAERQGQPEVALRIIGGERDLAGGDWCDDTHLALPFGLVNPASCAGTLANLVPRGGRPLVGALKAALADLAGAPDRRRLVIISSGTDQCGGNVIELLQGISDSTPPTEVRIIGLGLDRTTANAATVLAPTRNLFDLEQLPETLKWALQPADTRPSVVGEIDLRLSLNGTPPQSAEIELTDSTGSERAYAAVEKGRARVQLAPGRYRGTVRVGDGPTKKFAGLVIGSPNEAVELDLMDLPPVTLELAPGEAVAGGAARIAYWGAPPGSTWIALVVAESSSENYMVRRPTDGAHGEVAIDLPDAINELEARFVVELRPGFIQDLGRLRFRSDRPRAAIEAPDEIENGTPLVISWTGPGHGSDHITLAPRNAADTDHLVCMPARRESGSVVLTAPSDPGEYVVFYRSGRGQILDRHALEVFEILATLDGRSSASPGQTMEISWTGPDAELDYICISPLDSDDAEYISWTPSADGNPARLRAPIEPGTYEVRYVRSTDGAVLARRPLEIKVEEIRVRAPKSVVAGTRFTVRWSGTPHSGDFLAVAEVGASVRDTLDFVFASDGSPVSLAAPFEPGEYEIRYVTGSGLEVLASVPLHVR